MSVPEFYEAVFRWPHSEPNEVVVTGEFDAWSASKHLSRSPNGFEGTLPVPWGQKVAYKYIVDGKWTTTDDQPTEIDSIGNLNNVLNTPARPSTPKTPTLSSPQPPSKPGGQFNSVLVTAKNAAVAMVEAIAPGTTQSPLESPSPVAAKETAEPEKTVNGTIEDPKEDKLVIETPPAPAPAPEPVPTPEKEIAAQAVLPKALEEVPTPPTVPVPVLPLAKTEAEPIAAGGVQEPLETVVVEGSATAENVETPAPAAPAAVEPSTHTPAAAAAEIPAASEAPAAPTAVEPATAASTHTPIPPTEEKVNGASSAPETEKATTNGSVSSSIPTAESEKAPVNGTNGTNGTHPPSSAPAPATNGKSVSTPPPSPGKDKRHAFPSFGRNRRQSSSIASITSSTPDEQGSIHQSPTSRKGAQKEKRRTSFFGRIKDIFSDDQHRNQKK